MDHPVGQDKEILSGIVGSTIIRSMAMSMVMIFFPVYLYKLGGMNLAAGWLIVSRGMDFILMPTMAKFVGRLGYKKSVLGGQILWSIALLAIVGIEFNRWWIWVALILVPFAAMGYWIPRHMLFMETSKKEFGQDEGKLLVVGKWGAIFGPILGGLIVNEFGFGWVWAACSALMILAAIPIVMIKSEKLKWNFDLPDFWQKFYGVWFRRDFLAFVGLGIEETLFDYFWPVFLLVVLGQSYVSLGAYKTVVLLVTTVMIWIVGRKIDRGGVRKFMTVATGILAVFWLVRGGLVGGWWLLALDILDGWAGVMVFLPFAVYTYRRAVVSDKSLYLIEREAAVRLGSMLVGILVWGLYLMGISWQGIVWVGVLGLALMNLLPKIGPRQMEKMHT